MKKNEMEFLIEQIRYLLESEPNRNWTLSQIGDIVGYRGGKQKQLRYVLSDLIDGGVIQRGKNGTYKLAETKAEDLIEGKLELVRSGAGFVNDRESGRSVRIPANEIKDALPGDIVIVHPVRIGKDEESGRIVKIVKRSEKLICGTLQKAGKYNFVIPIDPSYPRDIFITDAKEANDGDRVVVRFIDWESGRDNPKGEIVEVIGPADKPSLDTEVICKEYELPDEFPSDVLAEAAEVAAYLDDKEDRLDLTKKYILTIDPATSKDFDDAISFTKHRDGTCELGVHIADVSHFVREKSKLDEEAYKRGNSIYLADKVIPMLPEQLSNGVCSLRPNEERLTFSAFITYDKKGNPVKRSFAKSIIKSKLRLNYAQALAIIDGRAPEGLDRVPKNAVTLLKGVSALAMQLRAIRMQNGALDLEVPESKIIIDKEGRMTGIEVEENDISHQTIEECMVAANEAVATELISRGKVVISRLHESPDPTKLDELILALRIMGLRPGDITKPAILSKFIASLADHPLKTQVHTQILRSMKRALYSAEGHGHFGLAKVYYSHFTSPIRRYPDLVLHRQLADYLVNPKQNSFSKAFLQRIAIHTTETEQRAEEAERTLLEIKKYRFLQQQLDDGKVDEYEAVISKVGNFGIFIDIPALMVGGLIHISTISKKYVRYNPQNESLSADGKRYAQGDTVKVFVTRVDFNAKRLDFALVK